MVSIQQNVLSALSTDWKELAFTSENLGQLPRVIPYWWVAWAV